MRKVCPTCQGNKQHRGMGCMIVKCKPCNATGSVEIEEEVKVKVEEKVEAIPQSDKKETKKSKKGIIDDEGSKSTEIAQ